MDKREYRKAIDALSFSEDFEARTVELLRQKAQPATGKETESMKRTKQKKIFWRAAIAVCLVAALTVSAAAAAGLFLPWGMDSRMAHAFEKEGAVEINKTIEWGDYAITLLGMTHNQGVTDDQGTPVWIDGEYSSRTYAVLAVKHLDGTPVEKGELNMPGCIVTPLISGYEPWVINDWTLDSVGHMSLENGTLYFSIDTEGLEKFSNHTVYLAFYRGETTPSSKIFTMAEDGSIAFRKDYDDIHALFTLPLDKSKADPELAEKRLEELKNNCGLKEQGFPEEGIRLGSSEGITFTIGGGARDGALNP